jgi:(E)-4-hydroxy-3-methylbut-2-enyl-diphosphate synthase
LWDCTGESRPPPVFIDGRKAATLRGPAIADEFQAMVVAYVESRWR